MHEHYGNRTLIETPAYFYKEQSNFTEPDDAAILDLIHSNDLEERIQRLICVTKPYYALKNLQESGNALQAEINIENIFSGESTIISGAEAGRHLAILGSCALALQNPLDEKHYYLANKAYIERGEDLSQIIKSGIIAGSRLVVKAKALELDLKKKSGNAEAAIYTQSGKLIFKLNVSYQVLKATLFQKLFSKNFFKNQFPIFENPYSKNIEIKNIAYDKTVLKGDLGIVSPEKCPGHFDNYPALPIAVLCSTLARLGAKHMGKLLHSSKLQYTIKKVDVSAHNLAFAGEHIMINSSFLRKDSSEYTFDVNATNREGKNIGAIKITYELLA